MGQTQNYCHLNLPSLGDHTAIKPLWVTYTIDHHTSCHLCFPSSSFSWEIENVREKEKLLRLGSGMCWLRWYFDTLVYIEIGLKKMPFTRDCPLFCYPKENYFYDILHMVHMGISFREAIIGGHGRVSLPDRCLLYFFLFLFYLSQTR